MKKKDSIWKNRKAQFFIASAITIVFVSTVTYNYYTQTERVDSPDLSAGDQAFLMYNMNEAFETAADLANSECSAMGSACTVAVAPLILRRHMSNTSEIINTLLDYRGMNVITTNTVSDANDSFMNGTTVFVFQTQNGEFEYTYNSRSEVYVEITAFNTISPCNVSFRALKDDGIYHADLDGYISEFLLDGTIDCSDDADYNLQITDDGNWSIECVLGGGDCVQNASLTIYDYRNITRNECRLYDPYLDECPPTPDLEIP